MRMKELFIKRYIMKYGSNIYTQTMSLYSGSFKKIFIFNNENNNK